MSLNKSTKKEKKTKVIPPNQKIINRILKWGKDHPTIGIPVPKINLKNWLLIITGEVEKPLSLTWNNLQNFHKEIHTIDFHCVEGWSVLNCEWEGIPFKSIVKKTMPKKGAMFVSFECADGYTTSLPLRDLLNKDALLAYKLDGKVLNECLGGPLRLVIPDKYAYKNAMWLVKIIFTLKKDLGYWEKRGYSDTADVWKNDRFAR